MLLIRRFEETAEQCYIRGLIHGTMHLSIGQEALSADHRLVDGVVAARFMRALREAVEHPGTLL